MSRQSDSLDSFLGHETNSLHHLKRSIKILDSVLDGCEFDANLTLSFIILGASGNLALKKVYPTLWRLYRDSLLPKRTFIFGFARTTLTVQEIQEKCLAYMKVEGNRDKLCKYWEINEYIRGYYHSDDDFKNLNARLEERENGGPGNRIFYVALPPNVIEEATISIKNNCTNTNGGWIKIVFERPFGRDLQTSDKLSKHVTSLFKEKQIFRIDHETANEIIQNVITLRFSNAFLAPTWNRHYIASVLISHKEDTGVYGRGGHFDNYGIIRDVMQTHLMQILALIAMEKPASCLPEDIRDEKLKVLKRIKPIRLRDVILGQYVGNPNGTGENRFGYLDDITVPRNSIIPTYAITVLKIKNERWEGVPFILRCGKALNEQRTEVRVQYCETPGDIFHNQTRNEFVFTLKPTQNIFMKILMKSPGVSFVVEDSQLDMTRSNRNSTAKVLDPYDRIILDVMCGSHIHCLRSDELHETWKIFTPILRQIEEDRIKPAPYVFGSQGPKEADRFLREYNFFVGENAGQQQKFSFY